ncbi:helix-turn-helix transcriptional regulator [Paenibacillus algorifonticola]|uniref:helix-turn-helix domain-containing protein n=1 Tax=Paenibacillus algorifonticola TaxID=684063 RepID=UPI003D287D8F
MKSDFLKLIGERIRAFRKERGYTQEFLAEKANIHYTYISDIERAERNLSLETLEKIIIALEVNPMQIFNFAEAEAAKEGAEKTITIEAISTLLHDRNTDEVKMVYRVLKDMFETFSRSGKN